ncbi:hypothetical protein BG011_007706 [Mortierella polycephala]|uniref:Uncharacterized protein n=1 Tax=Mortierella polycephala TaxID=41804 RepID=A0A9P6PS29_9FUNG|nr:hypothetical protein BG011_007706 [Mortierella polycephala]
MIEFAAAATTVTAKVSKDQDLDHGPQGFVPHQQQQQQQNDNHPVESQEHNTQLCNSSNGFSFAACSFIISAQSDLSLSCGMSPPTPIVPSQAPLNTTNSRGEDGHLQIAQEQWDETLDPCGNEAQTDGGYISDDLVDSLAIGKERKRLTRAEGDGDTFKKRRKDRIQEKPGTASFALTTMTKTKTKTATTNHLLHFLEIQLDQTAYQTSKGKREPALKQETTLDFDPSAVARSWTTPRRRNAHSKCGKPHYPPQYHGNQSNTYFCTQHQAADQHCQCRKRSFADAIELSRPLSANHCTVDHHPTWIESVKKRKIHQNPTKWTSTLSPAPYIKLLTVRDLWDVMETRMDLSWLADEELWGDCSDSVVESPLAVNCDPSTMEIAPSLAEITPDHPEEQVNAKDQAKKHRRSECRKIIRQCPCPSQFLRGLWEEELKEQRLRQMIPDTVRRPPRSKIFNSRPIATGPKNIKPSLPSLLTPSPSSESSPMSSVPTTPTGSDNASDTSAEEQSPQSSLTDLELSLKKKHRAAAIIRFHLRSMIKTAPTQWSFLLSIRHPGQVSIELLLALYGPHFMQTSNFRAIEQLLWGTKGSHQPQPETDGSSSLLHA